MHRLYIYRYRKEGQVCRYKCRWLERCDDTTWEMSTLLLLFLQWIQKQNKQASARIEEELLQVREEREEHQKALEQHERVNGFGKYKDFSAVWSAGHELIMWAWISKEAGQVIGHFSSVTVQVWLMYLSPISHNKESERRGREGLPSLQLHQEELDWMWRERRG